MYLDRASLKKIGLPFLGQDAGPPCQGDLCYKYLSFYFGAALILEQPPISIFSTCLLLLYNRVSASAAALKDSSASTASQLHLLTCAIRSAAARGRHHRSSRAAWSLAAVQPLFVVTIATARFVRRCSLLAVRSPLLVLFCSFR
ncbi:hypothetical protein M9H77_27052 [Catharanthus roseus]|uniref:Uncharacterized protein n=1 Tax=Catharanthus roseus TaxID=4058 RepID=A0ACC0ADK6_CATRO|nr:hypothetical protein M9H77_27052 [Catharanthus roseus]